MNIKGSKSMKPEDSVDLEKCHFLPHFETSNGYKLMYAPYNVFMFLKFFYALYERVVMAKQLVKEKVLQDLSEI